MTRREALTSLLCLPLTRAPRGGVGGYWVDESDDSRLAQIERMIRLWRQGCCRTGPAVWLIPTGNV